MPDALDQAFRHAATHDERVWVELDGGIKAAIVSLRDLALLDRYIEEIEDRIDVEEARKAMEEPGENIPWEQVKAELGLD